MINTFAVKGQNRVSDNILDSKYLNMSYVLSHKGANLKLAIMKKVYVMHLYKAFLVFYKFILNVLKIDIKW